MSKMSRYYHAYTEMKSTLICYLFNNLKMSKIRQTNDWIFSTVTQNGIKLRNPPLKSPQINKQGVCHTVALPFTTKKYLKAKRRIMKIQIIHQCKKYNLQKNSPKRNQNPSKCHNSITNLKFQHKLKYHLSKIII